MNEFDGIKSEGFNEGYLDIGGGSSNIEGAGEVIGTHDSEYTGA